MQKFFKKYCLIGIICTIVCKALFLYPPTDSIISHGASSKAFISISSTADKNKDRANGSFVEKKFFNLANGLTIWEGEETDEDEKPDESFQSQKRVITVLKVKDCDALNSLLCSATIPLFILFHSWKSFLSR